MAGSVSFPEFSSAVVAPVSFSSSGNQTVVAAVAGQTIRVLQLALVIGGTTNLTVKDGTVALTGAMPFVANGSIILDYNESGAAHFITSAGNGFVINNSSAVSVAGWISYTQGNS